MTQARESCEKERETKKRNEQREERTLYYSRVTRKAMEKEEEKMR